MENLTAFTLVALVGLMACGPGQPVGTLPAGDDGTGGAPDECPGYASMCDDDGLCWAHGPDWKAWALVSTPEQIQALHDQTVPVDLDGMECRESPTAGWAVCLVPYDCVTIVTFPLDVLPIVPGSCGDLPGPWTHTLVTSGGDCVGVFGPVGTRVIPG